MARWNVILCFLGAVGLASARLWDSVDSSDTQELAEGRVGGTAVATPANYPFWVLMYDPVASPRKNYGMGIAYNTKWVLTTRYSIISFQATSGGVNRGLTIEVLGDTTVVRHSRTFLYDSGSDLALVQVCPSFPTAVVATLASATPALASSVSYAMSPATAATPPVMTPTVGSKTVGEDCECDMYSRMDMTAAHTTFCLAGSADYSNWDLALSLAEAASGVFVFDTTTTPKKVIGFVITSANSSTSSEVVFDLTKNSRSTFLGQAVVTG